MSVVSRHSALLPAYMAPIALRAITGALKFRGFLAPKCYRPLRVPFMAHDAYRSQLRTCMRAYISGCIQAVTPFHVPKSSVVFPKHPRVAQALYNHHDALKQWAARRQPTCRCAAIKRHAPESPLYDGHVVASGVHFKDHLSTLERQVISGSSGDTYFPGQAPMWEQFRAAWTAWCATNHSCLAALAILSRLSKPCGRSTTKLWPPSATVALWTALKAKHKELFGTARTNLARPFATARCCTITCWMAPSATRTCSTKCRRLRRRTAQGSEGS